VNNSIHLSDDDLRELFSLFSSPTEDELAQIYSESHRLYFKNENLDEEYTLQQERGEFARDAWRAVLLYLNRHGYEIRKKEQMP
jgi:hypothetical protein